MYRMGNVRVEPEGRNLQSEKRVSSVVNDKDSEINVLPKETSEYVESYSAHWSDPRYYKEKIQIIHSLKVVIVTQYTAYGRVYFGKNLFMLENIKK